MARLRRTTVVLSIVLLAWFALDFVGVPGLVDREPLRSLAGLMLALMLLFVAGGMAGLRYLAWPYAAAMLIWITLQTETHWSTYWFAATPPKLTWYVRVFGDHWHLLPDRAGHTTPDAYHTILGVLLLANLLGALRDLGNRPSPNDVIAAGTAAIEPFRSMN